MPAISNTIVAAWTALCLQCAPQIHPATTVAIIKTESGGNPYAIGDNTTHKSYWPRSKDEAANIAYKLLSQGHSIDMGLMQVNSTHLRSMHLNYYDLFDSCTNIHAGGEILSDFYRQHDRPGQSPSTTLIKALSAYNTGSPYKGERNGYVSRIFRNTNPDFVFFKSGINPNVALADKQPEPQPQPEQSETSGEKPAKRQGNSMSFNNTNALSYNQ